jgi:uncharacterized protein YodC (DUF2158 family)
MDIIKNGDIVWLKSGSEAMVVVVVCDNICYCTWMDLDLNIKEKAFRSYVLTLDKPKI